MTCCPKKRTSKSKRDMRRAHDALFRSYAVVCQNCAEPVLRHHICPSCGFYRGRQIIPTKTEQGTSTSA